MAVPKLVIITQGNTQDIKLFGLQDADTGVFWTAATATATLKDQLGNITEVNNVTLAFVPGSTGNYIGTVTTTFAMPVGSGYVLVVDATQASSALHVEIPAEVAIRGQ